MEQVLGELKNIFYIYGMTMVRLTAAFALFPLINKQVIGGAMIRNGIIGSMAIFLYPLVSQQVPIANPGIFPFFSVILKEVFIGLIIGFVANIPFWALEAAGFFIDNQRGASMASSLNPLSGSESSPMGILFSQAFISFYLISGSFLLLLNSLFLSYKVWPIFEFFPKFNADTTVFILQQFDLIVTLSVWLAAPIIICMFITEFGIALISRSAPQLNVFILAMPIKSAVAVSILTIYIGTIMVLSKEHMLTFSTIMRKIQLLFL